MSSVLIVAKLGVWFVTGSVSVLAEAIHSCSDLVGSALALATVQIADDPPDADHAYGHGKFENVSGLMIAVLVFCVGVFAVYEAVQHLKTSSVVVSPGLALAVMAVSALCNALVSHNLLKVGRATDSAALKADGAHLRTDIVTAASVFAGLLLMRLTGLHWLDPATALVVSAFIFWIAFQVGRDALLTLSDAALPPHEEAIIREALVSDPRVLSYHKLRTRKAGSHRHVDVHVLLSDTLSFVTAHRITEELEDRLRGALPHVHPILHAEPYEDELNHQSEHHAGENGTQSPGSRPIQ